MFDKILSLLTGDDASSDARKFDDLQVAVAALLVHEASTDDNFDTDERRTIERLLAEGFKLGPEAVQRLLAAAERRAEDSTQLYPFTKVAIDRLDESGRIQLIEMLWEVAYADGVLHPDEDALVRRIAGLLYVSDHDRGEARKRVLRRRELARPGAEDEKKGPWAR